MKNVGLIIIILGLILTIYTGISYFTTDTVAQVGTLEITQRSPHLVSWTPFAGMAVMVVGGFIYLKSKK
jgi:hypothetical protein